ncbi:sporulation membrane protein YtrI [Lentibacillus juripiscarius]|uniref:Sporulation membrane protein YtrI n=1 Tax=Lentibacillus juripiscarius TaxID=257446 RepID=A0ABW5V946_9BACI
MHIPPYYKKSTWQRFLVGVFAGSIIGYLIFVYMYGSMYGQMLEENRELKSEVTELKNENEALLDDNKDLDEKTKTSAKVESIGITITNPDDLPDRLIIHQLEDLIKNEINHIKGKEVSIIAESDGLLEATVENKEFSIDDFKFKFKVRKLVITKTVKLSVKAEVSSGI